MLKLQNVKCGYEKHVVLNDVSFEVKPGEVVCILGANGVGKTTLFKTILGHLPVLAGKIFLKEKFLNQMSIVEKAKNIGYVPQAHNPPFPFLVRDVVVMGRTAYLSVFTSPGKSDMDIAEKALEDLGISYLKNKVYTEISGGERQLVLIARALAQTPSVLIMDEPTSNLDFGNQAKAVKQVRNLADRGLGVIMTTHFPDHVFQCADKVVVIKNSKQVISGQIDEIMTSDLLSEIYDIRISVKNIDGKNICIPIR